MNGIKEATRLVSLALVFSFVLGLLGRGSFFATAAENSASYTTDMSKYRITGVVQDLMDSHLYEDGIALPKEWNPASSDYNISKESKSTYYILKEKQVVLCSNMYAKIDIQVVEQPSSVKKIKLEWQFGALPKKWFRLDGKDFLNITGAGSYSALIDIGKLGLEPTDKLQNILVDSTGYSIRIKAMQIVMAKKLTGSGEYYQVGDTLYKQTAVAVSQSALKVPSLISGSANFDFANTVLNERPTYKAGYYLAVSMNVNYIDDDHFVFDRFLLRMGDHGEKTVDLLEVLGIDGDGHYEAFIDLSKYGISPTKWYGLSIGLAHGRINILQFELVSAHTVKSHTVTFLDSFGREYATTLVADGEAAEAPVPPPRLGYRFTGWKEDISNIQSDTTVAPQYEADAEKETVNVKVKNGYFSNGCTEYDYGMSDVCTVKALKEAPNGQIVSWVVKNNQQETVVAYGSTYAFRVTGPTEIEAVNIPQEDVRPIAYCDPNLKEIAEDNKEKTVMIPAKFWVPDGCTINRFGTVFIQGYALDAEEELTINTKNAVVLTGNSLNESGQWYRMVRTGRNYYIAARAFVEYKDSSGKTKIVYGEKTTYGKEQEYLNLPLREGDEIGVWWWHPVDMNKIKNRKYLNFLQKNGVTEIYGGFNFSDFHVSADFIEEANKRGMQVSALCGDSSWVTSSRGEMERTIQVCLNYNEWAKKNKRGLLHGIHVDLEPSGATAEIWKIYAEEVKIGYEKTRGTGLRFTMCTSAHLDDLTAEGMHITGDTAGYKGLWLHQWVQKYSDSVVLMSYGDSADDAHNMSLNELKYAQENKTGPLISGQETGPEETYVTYYDDTKEYLYDEVRKLYEMNVKICKDVPTGVAFHNVQTWYNLA